MSEEYSRIAQIIRYIEDNRIQQPGLDNIAEYFGLSPYHLQKIFKKWVGISPKQFLQYLTIEYARKILKESKSILEASFESGLSGPARMHDLFIIKKNIQDLDLNITRFFVIGKKNTRSTGNDKTTLVFYSKHKSGSLYTALGSFAHENINLTRLESMPSREKPWEYKFLIDLIGHVDDPPLQRALKDLQKKVSLVKILGSYPYYKI